MSLTHLQFPKTILIFHSKKTTRSQKRKAVAELVSGEFEASISENNLSEGLVAGPSKSPKIQPEKLDEVKTYLRKEVMSDLTKILADNQKEMPKLLAPMTKNTSDYHALENFDSAPENISVARTSTTVKTKATTSKTTPINSCNSHLTFKMNIS